MYINVKSGLEDPESEQTEKDYRTTEHDPMMELEGDYVSFESTT